MATTTQLALPSMKALQDAYAPGNICFGCGPANPDGLQIKSYPEGDDVVCDYLPAEHHQAFPGYVNGGIIGTLFDCHMNWTAAHRLMDGDELPFTVTASYDVRLLRPTPASETLHLRAHAVEVTGNKVMVESTMEAAGEVCAEASGVFVAVGEDHPAYQRW